MNNYIDLTLSDDVLLSVKNMTIWTIAMMEFIKDNISDFAGDISTSDDDDEK